MQIRMRPSALSSLIVLVATIIIAQQQCFPAAAADAEYSWDPNLELRNTTIIDEDGTTESSWLYVNGSAGYYPPETVDDMSQEDYNYLVETTSAAQVVVGFGMWNSVSGNVIEGLIITVYDWSTKEYTNISDIGDSAQYDGVLTYLNLTSSSSSSQLPIVTGLGVSASNCETVPSFRLLYQETNTTGGGLTDFTKGDYQDKCHYDLCCNDDGDDDDDDDDESDYDTPTHYYLPRFPYNQIITGVATYAEGGSGEYYFRRLYVKLGTGKLSEIGPWSSDIDMDDIDDDIVDVFNTVFESDAVQDYQFTTDGNDDSSSSCENSTIGDLHFCDISVSGTGSVEVDDCTDACDANYELCLQEQTAEKWECLGLCDPDLKCDEAKKECYDACTDDYSYSIKLKEITGLDSITMSNADIYQYAATGDATEDTVLKAYLTIAATDVTTTFSYDIEDDYYGNDDDSSKSVTIDYISMTAGARVYATCDDDDDDEGGVYFEVLSLQLNNVDWISKDWCPSTYSFIVDPAVNSLNDQITKQVNSILEDDVVPKINDQLSTQQIATISCSSGERRRRRRDRTRHLRSSSLDRSQQDN